MDKDYRKNQQRLTELAAAFADRCARAEQTAGKAHAANREAYKQRRIPGISWKRICGPWRQSSGKATGFRKNIRRTALCCPT